MRGHTNYNYDLFNEVEQALFQSFVRVSGEFFVCNPAKNFDGDQTLSTSTYMQKDISQVIEADALVLLPGWEHSEGAKLEVQVGKATGKEFYLAERAADGGWRFTMADAPTADMSPRASALDEAKSLITGDRNNAYGPPTQDFDRTAAMATAFGFGVNGQPVEGHHVAIFMILLKMSRLAWSPGKRDSWVDAAGYAGCGYECAAESR